MRTPSDVTPPRRLGRPSRRAWIAVGVLILFVVIASLHSLAVLWTDQMWFSQSGFGQVFTTMFVTKVELGVAFGLVFAALMWVNLMLTDRFGARDLSFDPEDEVVRRFQNTVRPYAGRIYGAIAAVTGFVAGINASGQWNTWLLFDHRQSFGATDPLNHKDVGLYVFDLPFISFVVTWVLVSLVVILIFTAVFHFFNGGIRAGRKTPRVSPAVKAHLSLVGAGIALMKSAGYVIARFELANSTNGVVQGAGYTDVHARMPAMTILIFLSLASAGILLANVRSRGWSLPAVAVGLWAFVALVIGVLYPTILQTFKVSPAQATLEKPYIADNITATRAAYGLTNVQYHNFAAANSVPSSVLKADTATLNNIRLWDPDPNIALETVIRRQSIRGYYTFASLGVDRYVINGKLTPVLLGVRELSTGSLPSATWVNTHLQYTHGIGVAALAANQEDPATGNPIFDVSNVPPVSTNGMPTLTTPDVYFAQGYTGWVVANTKQPELDYQVASGPDAGQTVETHYSAKGGVAVGGLFSRLALAARLGDFNFLISNQITSQSRVIFVRDPLAMAEKAAPFLSFDSQPYAVIANGAVNYVLDGYTTSSQYPYSQSASGLNVNLGGLPYNLNYVRNSVKVVVNADTGQMTFYVMDPTDPIIRAYEGAFPGMFHPLASMPLTIREHLRYPTDLFAVQAATLASYHISNASAFYNASDRWEVSPTTGAVPGASFQTTQSTDASGAVVSTTISPMSPVYQVGSLPQANHQQLLESLAFVPAGNSTTVQNLSAFMIATSDPSDYGQLHVYVSARGQQTVGPAQVDSEIAQNAKVSQEITLLDQHGSSVLLGSDIMVPLDQSVLYVRPFYVSSTSNPLPQLRFVIAAFNQEVGISSTLQGAIADVLGGTVPSGGGGGGSTGGKSASYYLTQASADYTAAQAALKAGNLGTYQTDVNLMNEALRLAQNALSTKG